jgi:DnaJ-class molecular chaperone
METITTNQDISWLISLFEQAEEAPAAPIIAPVKIKRCACTRCGGSGLVSQFRHVKGGSCFKCKGTGTITA